MTLHTWSGILRNVLTGVLTAGVLWLVHEATILEALPQKVDRLTTLQAKTSIVLYHHLTKDAARDGDADQ